MYQGKYVFAQITNRDSLRDLIVALDAHKAKSYHLGLGSSVNLWTLAGANIRRNYRIFEEFAYHLIVYARSVYASGEFEVKVDSNICWKIYSNCAGVDRQFQTKGG